MEVARMAPVLGRIGVWLFHGLLTPELAGEVEKLGYGTLWIGGSPGGDLELPERLLDGTSRLTVATGIVNIWQDDARTVAASVRRVEARHPGRFVLGVGAGHREATSEYERPYDALCRYLDVLDAEGVPASGRMLAALGPRVLRLSGERAAGAHPYLTTPEHTRRAREILGTALLAPEQKVVLEEDTARARAVAREAVTFYLSLSNYTSNFRRLGFTDEDLAGQGSDHLIDTLVAHGSAGAAAARVREHLTAGADHVAVQPLAPADEGPLPTLHRLAEALGDVTTAP
jgi:probable F420-dependent oxidoreductase